MRLAALTIVFGLATTYAQAPASPSATGSIKVVVRERGSGIPVDGAEVAVNRPGKSGPTAVTDADGTAVFPELAAATYQVKVTYKISEPAAGADPVRVSNQDQPDAAGQAAQTSFHVKQAVVKRGGITTVEFEIQHPATIRGQVLTSEGRPLIDAPVAALSVLRTFRSTPVLSPGPPDGDQAKTDAEGRFVIVGLTPGRYFLRVTLPPAGNQQLNYVYAPGVTSTAAATALSVDSGDNVVIGVTAVALPTVNVEGQVVDEAGHHVEGAQIRLRSLDQADPSPEVASSDREGHFVLTGVRIGTYVVQATLTGGNDSATLVGTTELEVGDKDVAPCEVKVVPGARIFGKLLFNGNEQPDPGRTEIRVRAEGDDRDLRDGLTPTPEWHKDGSFAISGVVGRHRLEVQSKSAWFIERAFLEDGTDLVDSAFNFEPGRIYRNVRVMLSDETAEIAGKLPADWTISPVAIVAFPADSALWNDGRYLKISTSSGPQTELTIKGVPPGRNYLVAIFVLPDRFDEPRLFMNPAEFLDALAERAVNVFVDKPGKYSVNLPDPRR